MYKTRFKLILPVQSQNVTKNRTDHRMHIEGIQICQIIRWSNSFQNMYGMNTQKLTVWPGKSVLCIKNTSKTAIFVCTNLSNTDQSHSANFGSIALKLIEHGVLVSEPMFYSFQSDGTKIGVVTLIRNTEIT